MDNVIFLANTDTTVGFLALTKNPLYRLKKRDKNKPFLQISPSLRLLQTICRVPNRYKNMVRRAKKSTFIYPNNKAIRVSKDKIHNRFLQKDYIDKPFYSTSANITDQKFDINFAIKNCNIIVYQNKIFQETTPSNLYKINNYSIQKIKRAN